MRNSRAKRSSEKIIEDQEKDRDRKRQKRDQNKDKPKEKTKPRSHGIALKNIVVEAHSVGEMIKVCPHCHALLFPKEEKKGNICCANGTVELEPLGPFPYLLQTLFKDKKFMENIRAYNSHLSFTSLGYKPDKSLSYNGIYTFRIQGTMYHNIGIKSSPFPLTY
jgi:hypothetical protein